MDHQRHQAKREEKMRSGRGGLRTVQGTKASVEWSGLVAAAAAVRGFLKFTHGPPLHFFSSFLSFHSFLLPQNPSASIVLECLALVFSVLLSFSPFGDTPGLHIRWCDSSSVCLSHFHPLEIPRTHVIHHHQLGLKCLPLGRQASV